TSKAISNIEKIGCLIYVSRNSYDYLAHSSIVILVIYTKSNDMFSRREFTGDITERFRLFIDDAVFGKYRPPIARIDGDLRLIQCRRLIRCLDSNKGLPILDAVQLHRDFRRRIVNYEGMALHLATQRHFGRIGGRVARND